MDITIPAPGQSVQRRVAVWLIVTITNYVNGRIEVSYDNASIFTRKCYRILVGSTQGLTESIPGQATVLEKLNTVPGAVWTFDARL